jgi:hypothetical protein
LRKAECTAREERRSAGPVRCARCALTNLPAHGDRSGIGRSPNNPILPSTLAGRGRVTEAHLTGQRKIFCFGARRDGGKGREEEAALLGERGLGGRQREKSASTVWFGGPPRYASNTVWGQPTHALADAQANARDHAPAQAPARTQSHADWSPRRQRFVWHRLLGHGFEKRSTKVLKHMTTQQKRASRVSRLPGSCRGNPGPRRTALGAEDPPPGLRRRS